MSVFIFSVLILFLIISCQSEPIEPTVSTPWVDPEPVKPIEKKCTLQTLVYQTIESENPGSGIYGLKFYFSKDTSFTYNYYSFEFKFNYDSKGFLNNQTLRVKELAGPNKRSYFEEIKYTYEQERLIRKEKFNDYVLTLVETYKYNELGELIEFSQSPNIGQQTGDMVVRKFKDGKQISYQETYDGVYYDYTDHYNEDGFILKGKSGSEFYSYDSNGNLVKKESWLEGELLAYYEYDYGDVNNLEEGIVHQKGHPKIGGYYGSDSHLKVEERKFEKLRNSTNPFDLIIKRRFTYVYNASGLIDNFTEHEQTFNTIALLDRKHFYQYYYTGCP